MDFRTNISIPTSTFTIQYNDGILLIGSCFTENIGRYLQYFGFDVNINPFGIIYNPISIFNVLQEIHINKQYSNADLLLHNDLYISLMHHGKFSNANAEVVLSEIQKELSQAHEFLKQANVLIISLGTALVYHHKEQNKIVSNCHKLPANVFEKRFLKVDEIKQTFSNLKQAFQDKKIIFTVSPVRHWRDGAIKNQRSKSILLESIHQLVEENENCFYFPSYEIMMDELRDYRFYEADMLHPNEVAIKYIWQQFSSTYFSTETKNINQEIEKGRLLFQHKIKHQHTKEHQLFEQKKQAFIQAFKQKNPSINIIF
ncbi:MAG: GSCFA domain-containing protein [Bacteroidetes bacterium]|nr:GSCFA domain-containing protein [Bacteroidota bacterium]